MLSWVWDKVPPKVIVCLPLVQMALAEGMKRFWKTPVNAPWEVAPSPMVMAASKTNSCCRKLFESQVPEIVHDGDAREKRRAEGVDRASQLGDAPVRATALSRELGAA